MVTGSRELGSKIYLCDIQKPRAETDMSPFPSRKLMVPPHFDEDDDDDKGQKQEMTRMEGTKTETTSSKKCSDYFQVVSCADMEGKLLDLSFVQKTVVCLSKASSSSGTTTISHVTI